MSNFTYSKSGLALTERFEGCRLEAYRDETGRLTIGYGHTGTDVCEGMVWTEDQAVRELALDTLWAAHVVNSRVTYPINQQEFDALADFVFNVGSGNFEGSALLRYLNEGMLAQAAAEFAKWDKAGGQEVAGLLRRRMAEEAEFES